MVKRIDELLQQGKDVLATRRFGKDGIYEFVDAGKIKGFRSAALSFLERTYSASHSHYREFDKLVDGYYPSDVEIGMSILQSARDEISGDWLFSIKSLITAEVFSDFIDMASYLVQQDYKDAAAVIAGSVLEEHLRQLCNRRDINVDMETTAGIKTKTSDRLNADLAAAEVYSKLDQKAVTMWLDLRNKAAHGRYDEYNKSQVVNMISGITEFMARVPP